MKKILFTFLFLFVFFAGYSQMSNNGGVVTVENGATLVIEGSYTSTSSGSIEIDGNVQLKGNFVNNGGSIATGSTGRLTFNGTSAQEITGSQSTTYHCAVEVNNTLGVSLTSTQTGSNQTLDSTLIFTNGKVTLNNFDLTLGSTGVSGADLNKYVVTNSTGQLLSTVAASPVVFPVGDTVYNPLTVQNSGTSDTYGVIAKRGFPSGWTPTDHAVKGHWLLTEGTSGGSILTLTPQWKNTQHQTSFQTSDCAVGVSANSGTTINWALSAAATANSPFFSKAGSPFSSVGVVLVGDYFFEGIDLDLDVMLAGPYSGSTMSTALNSLIPLTDPYSNGVTVTSIPATAVDWIEVQLRDDATPSTIVNKYSFFVDNAGNVLNTNGTVGTKLTGVSKGTYKVAVRHRNHLGAMTASGIDFTAAGPFAFNYTAGTGIYGTNAMRNMGTKWALWAGDTDGNGTVQFATGTSDITPISNAVIYAPGNPTFDPTFVGATVYSLADADMNATVQFATGASDITPVSASVTNNPANGSADPTLILTQQLP